MVYLLRHGEEIVEPASTSTPVGCLSMGWAAFLHPASINQLFLVSDQ